MFKKKMLWFIIVLFVLSVTISFNTKSVQADNRDRDRDRGEECVPDRDQDRDRDRDRDRDHDQEPDPYRDRDRDKQQLGKLDGEYNPYYISLDGEIYEWISGFNWRLTNYEENGDIEAMNKYVHRITLRYRFKNPEDIQGFVNWVHENKPWRSE